MLWFGVVCFSLVWNVLILFIVCWIGVAYFRFLCFGYCIFWFDVVCYVLVWFLDFLLCFWGGGVV